MMKDSRHNYEYDIDLLSETAPANAVRLVGREKRVLEIGCGPGSITKILAQEGLCQVTGLELDPDAIKIVRPYCEQVIQADLNSSDWPQLLEGVPLFDVVLAADVLEHLYDPLLALKRMARFVDSKGYIVVSLPHVGHAAVISCLVNGDFEYRDWGLLDRTHVRFFGLKNIESLFDQAGLKITEARYVVKSPEETEFASSWKKLSSPLQCELMKSPHSEVYQVVVKAVPKIYTGNAVSLVPPKNKNKRVYTCAVTALKTRVRQSLSPEQKTLLKKYLHMLGIRL